MARWGRQLEQGTVAVGARDRGGGQRRRWLEARLGMGTTKDLSPFVGRSQARGLGSGWRRRGSSLKEEASIDGARDLRRLDARS